MAYLPIKKIAVLGSGVMGAQIAAQFTAAGFPVLLFDMADEAVPNARIVAGIKQVKALKPQVWVTQTSLDQITPCNFTDDLSQLAEVDLVIEAVSEVYEIKSALYKKIAAHLSKEVILASNTSGLSINQLAKDLPQSLKSRFVGLHFFNPPRFVGLLEMIPLAENKPEWLAALGDFLTRYLGKRVIHCFDTPNFIANRVGIFSLLSAFHRAAQFDIGLDCLDELTGPLIGRPRSAICRTIDLVGLDVLAATVNTMADRLSDDPWHNHYVLPQWIRDHIDAGHLGQKVGQGIYHKTAKGLLVWDIALGQYRPVQKALSSKVKKIIQGNDWAKAMRLLKESKEPQAQFLWWLHADLWHYAACCAKDIAAHVGLIDMALCAGFQWKKGPFALWQQADAPFVLQSLQQALAEDQLMSTEKFPDWVASVVADQGFQKEKSYYAPGEKNYVPWPKTLPSDEGDESCDRSSRKKIIFEKDEIICYQDPDGVCVVSLRSKMHVINSVVLKGLHHAIDYAQAQQMPIVIWSPDGPHFSAGADLKQFATAFLLGGGWTLSKVIHSFQDALMRLKYASVPVVAAVRGFALGGGCELLMHCDTVVASMNSFIGLVEMAVGVIPAGGGCKELALRAAKLTDHRAQLTAFCQQVGQAKVAQSAAEAKEMGYLPQDALILMQEDKLFEVAKRRALDLAQANYVPPIEADICVLGASWLAMCQAQCLNLRLGGLMSEHDGLIVNELATVLAGGDLSSASFVPESFLLQLEREAFVRLVKTRLTQQRVKHMLKTGKPLRN